MYFSFLPVGSGQEYIHHPVGYGRCRYSYPQLKDSVLILTLSLLENIDTGATVFR